MIYWTDILKEFLRISIPRIFTWGKWWFKKHLCRLLQNTEKESVESTLASCIISPMWYPHALCTIQAELNNLYPFCSGSPWALSLDLFSLLFHSLDSFSHVTLSPIYTVVTPTILFFFSIDLFLEVYIQLSIRHLCLHMSSKIWANLSFWWFSIWVASLKTCPLHFIATLSDWFHGPKTSLGGSLTASFFSFFFF